MLAAKHLCFSCNARRCIAAGPEPTALTLTHSRVLAQITSNRLSSYEVYITSRGRLHNINANSNSSGFVAIRKILTFQRTSVIGNHTPKVKLPVHFGSIPPLKKS